MKATKKGNLEEITGFIPPLLSLLGKKKKNDIVWIALVGLENILEVIGQCSPCVEIRGQCSAILI